MYISIFRLLLPKLLEFYPNVKTRQISPAPTVWRLIPQLLFQKPQTDGAFGSDGSLALCTVSELN